MPKPSKVSTVLVLEDDKSLQQAIKTKLEHSNFQVIAGRTVREGEQAIASGQPIQVIWLDHYLLGDGSGLDFVVKLKSDRRWRRLPIFVVSNSSSPEKERAYLALGVQRFYTKANASLEQIVKDIRQAIDRID